MDTSIFEKLYAEELISGASLHKVKERQAGRLFSVHWELKSILYLGVLMLTTGAGILVYKNIDTIGHQIILLTIALVSAGSFVYCLKMKPPFSWSKVESPNAFFDYILLLGCLALLIFLGYLQFQYNVFGNRFGLALFIPMIILFAVAYYFDHLGVLSMAITNLAAWAGIAINPTSILSGNDFNDTAIIYTGISLGAFLICLGAVSRLKKLKAHFCFTYTNFGAHILFISCLAAMFQFDRVYLLWLLLLLAIAFYFYREAFRTRSFYFMLILTIYTYIGISYAVVRLLVYNAYLDEGGFYLTSLYFMGTGVGLILFLINANKKLKHYDSI